MATTQYRYLFADPATAPTGAGFGVAFIVEHLTEMIFNKFWR